MFNWFKSWKKRRELKKLVRQMGGLLKERYGFQEYYTGEQVLKTYQLSGLPPDGQDYAIAMFVQPDMADRFLTKLAGTKLAKAVREYMIGTCFGFSGGHDPGGDYNIFMHHPVGSHHGHGGSGFFDGGHHHGGHGGHSHDGGSGGGFGGDSGGGHH